MDVITDWSNTLVYIGLFFVVKKALGLIGNIYAGWRAYVLPGLFKNENFTEKFGGWAVVTGCTGGIGREYALGLARKGMNLVLVSRSKQKLEDLEQQIVKTYKVKTMVIVADFTQIEVLDYIVTKLRESKVDIGVLVNNVGILGPLFQPFLEFDKKTVKDMITVNISATTVLCHELLPDMVKKGKGAIINIASTASYLPGTRVLLEDRKFLKDVTFGKTKIFVRSPSTLFELEKARSQLIPGIVIFLQKMCRGSLARKQYKRMVAARLIWGK